jgi:hypothetical protein
LAKRLAKLRVAATVAQLRSAPDVLDVMRSIGHSVVFAVVLLATASVAGAAKGHHHKHLPPLCSPGASPFKSKTQPYRRTLGVDPVAQVYSLGGGPPPKPPPPGSPRTEESKRQIYGCVYGHRGAYSLGTEPYREVTKYLSETYFGDRNIVLAGPIVAYEHYSFAEGLGGIRQGVVVEDLRTGVTLRDEATGKRKVPGGEPELEFGIGHTAAIVVKSDGSVAWILETSAQEDTYQVHAADMTGSRLLASGPDIDPSSLALAGNTLYWMQGGKPFSAMLN